MEPNQTNPQPTQKKIGPIIVIFIVVVIIIAIVIYNLISRSDERVENTYSNIAPITNTTNDVESLQNDLDRAIEGLDSQTF